KIKRIDVSTLEELKRELINEGYKVDFLSDKELEAFVSKEFEVESEVLNKVLDKIKDEVSYRAKNVREILEYIIKDIVFEEEFLKLSNILEKIEKIEIKREEYEREVYEIEEVSHILEDIEEAKRYSEDSLSLEEFNEIEGLEKRLEMENVFTKDIELLKKIIMKKDNYIESYNKETSIKTIEVKVEKISLDYIKHKKGTVEYMDYLNDNFKRLKSVINFLENKEGIVKINQSNLLLDSINIAVVDFNNKKFKAISGSKEIDGYVKWTKNGFKAMRVNRLGQVGTGYRRIYDSEKKILDNIDKEIREKNLKGFGTLKLYSKWEPCPSCYYVISQFKEKYPKIDIEIKYSRKYGS
ncbi:MAG: deaminase domain-containing protein, partial [Clostridium sp.]|uniref:deaminase domain-containing protein n=1 Tax=Clostridium sp. TaxID=1506 RepID=UPI003F3DC5FE